MDAPWASASAAKESARAWASTIPEAGECRAATPVRDAVLEAALVQELPTLYAQHRLARARGVVEPGVDDLGVAARNLARHGGMAFEHHHEAPCAGERRRHGEADHTGAHDDDAAFARHGLGAKQERPEGTRASGPP